MVKDVSGVKIKKNIRKTKYSGSKNLAIKAVSLHG